MKTAIKIILNIVFAIFILLALLIALSLLPIKGNISVMTVMSGSMEPAIKTGTLIFVKPLSEYQIGNIVTFKESNNNIDKRITTHRIFNIPGTGEEVLFQTKGDANDSVDANKINKNQIIGKYIFGIPYLGYVVAFIKTLPGLILLIIVPATIIIYEESRKVQREAKLMLEKRRKEKSTKKSESDLSNKSSLDNQTFKKEEGSEDAVKAKEDS